VKATAAVRSVEVRMLEGLTSAEQADMSRMLRSMIQALNSGHDQL